jgi:hypothetical protein
MIIIRIGIQHVEPAVCLPGLLRLPHLLSASHS